MAYRQKKIKQRPSIQKQIIQEISTAEPINVTDPKEIVFQELLNSLLSRATIKFEINKSFSRLAFYNANSYYGWIGSNGLNGFGTYIFADGTSFKGSFERSLTKGLGRYNYKNGDVYEGEFLAGSRHGYGQYKTKRFRYDGYFQNGKFHGPGVWKSRTEEVKGNFYEGKITHGEVRDSSGIFKGNFDQSGLRKQGSLTFKNGNTYNGSWSDDLFCGFGIFNWIEEGYPSTKAETKYIGYWLHGKRHGIGMLTFLHRCVICQWHCDKKFGAGVIVTCNGNCYAGQDMFTENVYHGSYRVKQCQESRDILSQIFTLATVHNTNDTMEEKSHVFIGKTKELLKNNSDWVSGVYPVQIPEYEIGRLSQEQHNNSFEVKCLQQVLTENYEDFSKLYRNYIHPTDNYMNNLSLNLFYMDVFHEVKDVNVAYCMNAGILAANRNTFSSENNPLASVSFYEFFQHFLHITEVLMENEELQVVVNQYKPTFFGSLSMRVLFVLRMLQVHVVPPFLVREGIHVNRPAILSILQSLKEISPNEKSIRAAYRFLMTKEIIRSTNFVQAVMRYFEMRINEADYDISDLELVEIVLNTCKLNLDGKIRTENDIPR